MEARGLTCRVWAQRWKSGVAGLSDGTPKTSTSVSDGKDGGRGRNRTFNLLFGRQTLKMNDFKESQ